MRIIHIIPSLKIGGAERLVIDICEEIYFSKKHDLKLITFKSSSNNFKSPPPFYIHIPSHFNPSITSKSKVKIDELQQFIFNYKPDIIHSHLWETEMLLTNIDPGKSIRFTHFHDNIPQLNKSTFPIGKKEIINKYEKYKFLKSKSENFICISNDTLLYAKRVLPRKLRKNIFLVKNAINYKKFYSDKKKNINKIKLINVGSFVNKKNQKLAVKVLNEILKKGYESELIFLGNGPLINEVKGLVKELNIKNLVKFKGNVTNVPDYLNKSNFYLHTATYEPFGLVLIEAMASGLPVISLDGYGNRDFINHGQNGYIFKDQEPKLLANCIIDLFNKPELFEKIKKNGHQLAKEYDIKEYTLNLLKIYKASISSIN